MPGQAGSWSAKFFLNIVDFPPAEEPPVKSNRNRKALTSAAAAMIVMAIALSAVAIVYVNSAQGNQDQLNSASTQIQALKSQLQQLSAEQRSLNASVKALGGTLPVVNQHPTVRVITVEWAEFLSQQDRFFTNFIIVNQGDMVDVTFISNDTASHTFTLDSPYSFQINGSIPGTVDDPTGQVFTTQPTNNSPGVSCSPESTPGNVTCSGSFLAQYPGIYEYYCVYHIHLGMFGYLVVLPNAAYSSTSTTTTTTTTHTISGPTIGITQGAGGANNPIGFTPDLIKVKLGTNATVTWINQDGVDHTVTSETGAFNSGTLAPGAEFSYTFTAPGNYTYGCEFHPFMRGTVVVLPAS